MVGTIVDEPTQMQSQATVVPPRLEVAEDRRGGTTVAWLCICVGSSTVVPTIVCLAGRGV